MILSQQIMGNIKDTSLEVDWLHLEWHEAMRPIQRKRTERGQEIALKFTKQGVYLKQGDILWQEGSVCIAIDILPCEAIVVTPATLYQMGTICYEIGNKHLPLFIENNQVLVAYEDPLFRLLKAAGYEPIKEVRRLQNMLKANIDHAHGGTQSGSFFQKILNLPS